MKLVLALVLLLPFVVTLYGWSRQEYEFYGSAPGAAAGVFMAIGIPCGLFSLLLLWLWAQSDPLAYKSPDNDDDENRQ
jgi:hypothetical protein